MAWSLKLLNNCTSKKEGTSSNAHIRKWQLRQVRLINPSKRESILSFLIGGTQHHLLIGFHPQREHHNIFHSEVMKIISKSCDKNWYFLERLLTEINDLDFLKIWPHFPKDTFRILLFNKWPFQSRFCYSKTLKIKRLIQFSI